jgi:hypothetical protein
LISIFCIQGAPLILQSDNGREFVAEIIEEVMKMWPDVVLVHGRPRHPQSQGSVERANQDVEPMIGNWMKDNHSKNWVLGLNFVQLAKNTRYHSGVGNKPYTLQYGQQCRYGCINLPVDRSVLLKLRSEDDLNQLLTSVSFVTSSSASPTPPVETEPTLLTDSPPVDAEGILMMDTPPVEDEPIIMMDTPTVNANINVLTYTPPVDAEIHVLNYTPPVEVELPALTDAPLVEVAPTLLTDTTVVVVEEGQLSRCAKCNNQMTHDYECIGCGCPVHWFCASGDPAENEEKGHGKHYWCPSCDTKKKSVQVTQDNLEASEHDTPMRGMIRSKVSANQVSQSDRMKKRFREDTMSDVTVGSVCLVPIDKVDRSKIDPKRLPCVVVEVTPREQYRLACKAGVLDKVLQRQDFLHEANKTPVFYGLNAVLQNWRTMKKVSIRTGSGVIAPSGGQGHLHCNCSGKCDTKRCGCLRGGQKCNSRCHPTNSKCCNKCE